MSSNQKYELVVATKEAINDLNIVGHMKEKRILGAGNQFFQYKKKTYHLTDNNGVAISFEERKELEIFYSSVNNDITLKLAKVDSVPYQVKEGYPDKEQSEFEYELAFTRKSCINYKGINYELHDMNCNRAYIEKDSQIVLEIKNGVPITGTLNKYKYIIIPSLV